MLLNSTDLLSSDFVSCMMNIISYVYALIFLLSLVLIKVLFLLKREFSSLLLLLVGGQALPRDNFDCKSWIHKDTFVFRGISKCWEPQEPFLQVLMQLQSNLNIILLFNSMWRWASCHISKLWRL